MRNKLGWAGGILTCLYLGFIITTLILRYQDFVSLDLNELGDFLAGALGPVAFLWLVLGFFLQSQSLQLSAETLRVQTIELEQSTRALKEQATELTNSVAQQTIMARAASLQMELQRLAVERQLAETELQMAADFSLESTWTLAGFSAGHLMFKLRITNHGKRASHIKMILSPPMGGSSEINLDPIRSGENFYIEVEVDCSKTPLNGSCVINYVGIDGKPRVDSFDYNLEHSQAKLVFYKLN